MRILVLSDSHGDLAALAMAIEAFQASHDLIIHAGDGAMDLARLRMAGLGLKPWEAVRGNADYSGDMGTSRVLDLGGYRVFLCHGHLLGIGESLDALIRASHGCSIVIFGHSHRPYAKRHQGRLFLNPGSIARPRGRKSGTLLSLDLGEAGPRYRFYQRDEGLESRFSPIDA